MKNKMKSILKSIFALTAFSLLFAAPLASQESRHALLIANGTYKHFSSLAGPVKEAETLRAALEQIGFTVKIVKNASLEEMNDALFDFEAIVKKSGGTAFFHYGGHAVQVAGKNYLIPSTAEIPDEQRVKTRALDADEVMNCMAADTNIVVFDSCRNNPLPAGSGRSASRGLAAFSVKPKNSIIVYSAEAGCTAQDGVFTPVLAKELTRKGESLQAMLINVRREVQRLTDGAQTPGEYSQMTDIVYLARNNSTTKTENHSVSQDGASVAVSQASGSLKVSSHQAGSVYLDGIQAGTVRAYGTLVLDNLPAGMYAVEFRGTDTFSRNVIVKENEMADVRFEPETKHVKAQATEKGILFTIQRPEDKAYSEGFGTVIIYKLAKSGDEIVRAYLVNGTAVRKKNLNCLFPLCEAGEDCHFRIQINPVINENKNLAYYEKELHEELHIKAKGGSGFSYNEKGKITAFFRDEKPGVSITESKYWKNRRRTVYLNFFAGNGNFSVPGSTVWVASHEKSLLPGESLSLKSMSNASKLAAEKREFYVEFFYNFTVPESSGIKFFSVLQSTSSARL